MTNFLDKVKRIFVKNEMDEPKEQQSSGQSSLEPSEPDVKLTEATVIELMKRLEVTREDAYSCQEAYALLEEYVELVASDEEAALLMPLVKNHVDMCPDCTDHFQILLNILKSETDSSDTPEQLPE